MRFNSLYFICEKIPMKLIWLVNATDFALGHKTYAFYEIGLTVYKMKKSLYGREKH